MPTDGHTLELHALQVLLDSIPSNKCPVVLIIMAKNIIQPTDVFHKPYLLQGVMESHRLPWAVSWPYGPVGKIGGYFSTSSYAK